MTSSWRRSSADSRRRGIFAHVNTWAFYALWILGPTLLGVAMGQPLMLVAVVAAIALYRWLPDPAVWLRGASKKRSLEDAVLVNPENLTARRDLATIFLERKRPKRAIDVLLPAREREATAEIEHLLGCARLESGDAQGALVHLEAAVQKDPKVRYGDPFLMAGRAHLALGKLDLAEGALTKFVQTNGSSVEGLVRLARVRSKRGDAAGAKKAFGEARVTYRQLPGFARRKQRGWWLRALIGL
jgi:tetratricopeptide (TPR) repeat protein